MVAEMSLDDREVSNDVKPKDKCHYVYIIFFFIGVGAGLPWNFFITANQYFMYQFRNRSLPADVDSLSPIYRTPIQTLFTNYLAICSLIPLAITNYVNLMLNECFSAFTRLVASAILMLLMFILTVVFTKLDTVGSSLNQGSTYGILAFLPDKNGRGYLEGQAMAGIIAAVTNVITIAFVSNPQGVGFVYFLIAVSFIVLTIVLFFLLFKNDYFMYYWKKADNLKNKDAQPISKRMKVIASRIWHALWEIRWAGIVAFLTFATTLCIFPSVLVLVVPQNQSSGHIWETKYFHAVSVFVSFNICDYLGRMMVGCVKWPKFEQRKTFVALAIVRIAIVPLVMFCNVQPRRLPVAFHHDAFPIIFVILLGLTNGYFVCLAVNYASRYATKGNEESCGIATAAYITTGLAIGVAISYGLVIAL